MKQVNKFKYLQFIPFKEIRQWDVKRYGVNSFHFTNSISLKKILTPYSKPVSKKEMEENCWSIISKINFAGILFLRDISETSSYKGNLNKIDGDTLIYSKINVRHGCIYYHDKDAVPFGVSSEYPAFKIDTNKISGDYLVYVIQSQHFKDLLNGITSGIAKARVKPNEFLDITIPLPSLAEQRALVAEYNAKMTQAIKLEEQVLASETDIKTYVLETLGINIGKQNESSQSKYVFLKIVGYKNIEEWGFDKIFNKNKINSQKYKTTKIKELCNVGSGGTPSRSQQQYYKGNIPWIKTGEVLDDVILDTEEHITQEAINNSSAKIYPQGSLIIAMYGQGNTRGRTAKLGVDATTNQACAVLFDIDNNIVITDYLWYYLQVQYDNLRSMASGNNQPNLNADKIKNYNVVIPPIPIQKEIVEYINVQKEQIKKYKLQVEQLRTQALMNFENQIFLSENI